jgi:hypothetical protein
MAVTTAKEAEEVTEQAFGHRLYPVAIKAGTVVSKTDPKTIYVVGMPPFIQAGLLLHLITSMIFEKVQRLAYDMGTSLRQTALLVVSPPLKGKPSGVKHIVSRIPRVGAVGVCRADESSSDARSGSGKNSAAAPLNRRGMEVEVDVAQ